MRALVLQLGIGFLDGAVILTAVWLFGVHMVPWIERKVYRYSRYLTLYIEVEDGKAITHVSRQLKEDNCLVDSFHVDKPKAKGQYFQIVVTFRIPPKTNREDYIGVLQKLKGVLSVDEI